MPTDSNNHSVRILHVEDDPDFAQLTAEFLQRENSLFQVDMAINAEKALNRFSDGDYDCIISDYDMPGMNGIEFLKQVRQNHPDLPFILYTGKGSEEVASEAISNGVTEYLQKDVGTVQYEVLSNRIENVVEGYLTRQNIEAQKDQYQHLFEQAPVMYAVTRSQDGEPIIEECNQWFVDKLGYSRSELVGNPVSKFCTDESNERMIERGGYERALNDEFTVEEREFVTKDGSKLNVLLRAVPRINEQGDVIGSLCLYVDKLEGR